jgi:hypothetical protein
MLLPISAVAVSATYEPTGLAELRIDNAIARVKVIPEARGGIAVAVQQGKSGPPLRITRTGASVVIDGQEPQAGFSFVPQWISRWFRKGRCPAEASGAPVVTAHVPMNTRVSVSGAVSGEIGATTSLSFNARGCGDWRLGPVERDLAIDTSSTGRLRTAWVGGTLAIHASGSGDIAIDSGHIATARIILLGPGNITHKGSMGALFAEVKGSGKIKVKEIYGLVDAEVVGTGDVFYARPAAKRY